MGNSAGTPEEMNELMEITVARGVQAHIECFELSQINEVLQRLERGEIDGRAVVRIP